MNEARKTMPTLPDNLEALFEDKKALREKVMEHLFTESSKGNANASDKLAKIAGLSEAEQSVTIVLEDFSKMIIDCPFCGKNVYQPQIG